MKASLRALLENIVDYAGLFPPASLELDPAIRNFARDRAGADSWMLARFVIPAARLAELRDYHDELFANRPPFRFSVLVGGGSDEAEFASLLNRATAQVQGFCDAHADRVQVDALEVRLPQSVEQDGFDFDAIRAAIRQIFHTPAGKVSAFLEVAPCNEWDRISRATIESILAARKSGDGWLGYKLRTGGVDAEAFPTIERVATTIARCVDLQIPIKFTAGLHHPIRHFNDSVSTKMLGFINVFGVGALLCGSTDSKISSAELHRILETETASDFEFRDDCLEFDSHRVETKTVRTARKKLLISFGSCSFDEPREDLRALGWM